LTAPSLREARVFAARMHDLAGARALVEAFGRALGLSRDDVLRIVLVVEELFTNTVKHGYGRECDEPIEVTLESRGEIVTLHYRDAAARFDPLDCLDAARAALDAPLEARPDGGLGMPIVAGLARDISYAFADGRNCLKVTLRAAPSPHQPCAAC
jgi:serine/threonine-protein kinase RsbW